MGYKGTCMLPPAPVYLTSACDADPGTGGAAKPPAEPVTSKLFIEASLNRAGSVTPVVGAEAAPGGPDPGVATGGAQFSQRLSKWNHSASDMRSPPPADVVGVAAAVGMIPGDVDGPETTLAELRRTRSGPVCACC